MSTIRIITHDEEWLDLLTNRIEKALEPEIKKLDTVNKQYPIIINIEELPE